MNRTRTYHTLYVPTLLSKDGTRHIIPSKDKPARCGATGEQYAPHDWRAAQLCQRCVQKEVRLLLEGRLDAAGL